MSTTKRPYNKKSSYWENRKGGNPVGVSMGANGGPSLVNSLPDISFDEPIGEPYMSSSASCRTGTSPLYRPQSSLLENGYFAQQNFVNLKSGCLPYSSRNGYINVTEAIELCQRAYANVAIFKNTIDVMTEFSNSKLHLRGENEAAKTFFYKWFEKIGLYQLKEEFFREYYRSGNVFIYKINGSFSADDYVKLKNGMEKNKLPLRYYIINPACVAVEGALTYDYNYVKLLSGYELQRIKHPKTDEDKAVRESIGVEALKAIDGMTNTFGDVYLPMNPENLFYVFYKKQGYEPFAIPMGYPVLNDIEYKLQLKKMDMALTRTVENIILLVTMGAEPDKGGVNRKNVEAMQALFMNQAAGRVIVADYTTEAKFVIPELKEILGPQKYEVVNADINEGLQNILIGSEKFANQFIKTKVFLERLHEGQEAFINNFLFPEMKKLAQNMGFRTCPVPLFEKIDLKDEIQFAKVVTRLAEIGTITADQAIETLDSGLYPDRETLVSKQEEYKVLRDKGLFNPLLGGSNQGEGGESVNKKGNGRPSGSSGTPQSTKKVAPIGSGKANYSAKAIAEVYKKASQLDVFAEKLLKEKHGLKKLSKLQKETANSISQKIISQNKMSEWENCLAAFVKEEKLVVNDDMVKSVEEIQSELNCDFYNSSIMYHSKEIEK